MASPKLERVSTRKGNIYVNELVSSGGAGHSIPRGRDGFPLVPKNTLESITVYKLDICVYKKTHYLWV